MKVVHVVPHIHEEASGPSYSVPRLCQAVAACGNMVELKCLAAAGDIDDVALGVHRQWRGTGRFAVSSDMARALRRAAKNVDVIHNHSLWSMVNVAAGWLVPGHRAKLVTSPRGTLSAWSLARSRHVKRVLWPLQRRALMRADLLHATCDMELDEIRALGLCVPVAVIPNGVDVPAQAQLPATTTVRTVLFLSRIHPKKGVATLLHAWRRLQDEYPDWQLVIAGRGEAAHVQAVRQLASRLELQRVHFPGPLYGEDKLRAYAQAQLFVLPTESENFGLVVAEALAHGCPAIVTQGAPWQGLQTERCGWWIANDTALLAHTMNDAMHLPRTVLAAMGARGREWVMRDFSWKAIGQQMDASYRWLLGDADQPSCVHLVEGGKTA